MKPKNYTTQRIKKKEWKPLRTTSRSLNSFAFKSFDQILKESIVTKTTS